MQGFFAFDCKGHRILRVKYAKKTVDFCQLSSVICCIRLLAIIIRKEQMIHLRRKEIAYI